jgi:hypothetical protein
VDLRTAIFQANPAYELVSFAELPAHERDLFAASDADSEYVGLLCPRQGATLGTKAVGRETVRLFRSLQRGPGTLAPFLFDQAGDEGFRVIRSLVLDSVLMIERLGKFVTGPAALDALAPLPLLVVSEGTSGLSLEALRYAEALPINDAPTLAWRLYCYGRVPITTRWRRRLPDANSVHRELGSILGGRNEQALTRTWAPMGKNSGWLAWQRRGMTAPAVPDRPTYKLYISPWAEGVPEAFDALVSVAGEVRAEAFKVGCDASGWLRPDKMVVYFDDRDSLVEFAAAVRRRLSGMRAHGVPFSAPFVSSDRLLSWGSDPPEERGLPSWLRRVSWRQWVTNALAVAVSAAKHSPSPGITPAEYALTKLHIDGVDTVTWSRILPDADRSVR